MRVRYYRVKVGREVPRSGVVVIRSSERKKQEASSERVSRHANEVFRNQGDSKAMSGLAIEARVGTFIK